MSIPIEARQLSMLWCQVDVVLCSPFTFCMYIQYYCIEKALKQFLHESE